MTAPEGAIQYELYGCDYKVLITPQGAPSSFDITSRIPQKLTYAQQVVSYSLTEWADIKGYVTIDIDLGTKIIPDHEYNIIYRFGQAYSADIKESMSINVYRADGSLYKSIPINEWSATHWHTGLSNGVDSLQEVNLNFIVQRSYLPESGYSIKLSIDFQTFLPSTSSEGQLLYTSRYMYLTDLDDNTGILERIIAAIKAIPNSIKEFFSSLGDRISGFFTDLAQSIGGWFADLKAKIQEFFDGVKQWFQELGDRISGFFVDLYNNIVDGLKKLFIPSDGYFEGKKSELETFATDHFGAMYQAPDVMVDTIRKFTSMKPKDPAITMPAIEFNFQGKHYKLCDSMTYSFSWVNDKSHMLYYFYHFYKGFVTMILFFGFANYCLKKYNDVFGGSDE